MPVDKLLNQPKTNKAFTLIELLVVISILGIFAVIAYPNVVKWINDREVKAEAYKTVGYLKEIKSTISSGRYGMLQVALQAGVQVYTMSNENYSNVYKKLTSNSTFKTNKSCSYRQSGTSRNTDLEMIDFPSSGSDYIVHIAPTRTVLCMTTDGTLTINGNQSERDAETGKTVTVFIICSKGNTSRASCTYRARHDNMYKVTIDKYVNTKIYRLKNRNTWVKIDG